MALAGIVGLAGCDGPQSTLVTAGVEAERIAELTWWMFGAAAAIWVAVIGVALYATWLRPGQHRPALVRGLIIGGGAVFPTVVLAGLLGYGLYLLPEIRTPLPDGGLRVAVSGERWWWRVHYQTPEGEVVPLANEIRLPVGEPVAFEVSSPDVIHSFWMPSLAGKIDMIPGRVNHLVVEPTRTGIFRGACAEFCGRSHALMNFAIVVMEPAAFAAWLDQQAAPAQLPETPRTRRGRELFLAYGCGGCHRIRGTPADGDIGPDLTHVGSRLTLGAGILPNEPDAFARWIAHTDAIKPGVNMPPYPMLPPDELAAIAAYLDSLR